MVVTWKPIAIIVSISVAVAFVIAGYILANTAIGIIEWKYG